MIAITDRIALDEAEIVVTFIRASGPGGQNVNKVSSAAQLRFNVRRSPSLPDAVRLRLERIAGARLTKDGEIVLTAGNFRTQEAKCVALIRENRGGVPDQQTLIRRSQRTYTPRSGRGMPSHRSS